MIVTVSYVRAAFGRPRRRPAQAGTGTRRPSTSLRAVLTRHLRYLERRQAGGSETNPPRLFSATREVVTREEAMTSLLTWAHAQRAFYRLVLSPAGPQGGEAVEDWLEYTRGVLADFADQRGVRLRWVAVQHANTAHPHVHVVLAGGWQDREGQLHLLRLGRADLVALRVIGRAQTDYPVRRHDLAVLAAEEYAEEVRRTQDRHRMAVQTVSRNQEAAAAFPRGRRRRD